MVREIELVLRPEDINDRLVQITLAAAILQVNPQEIKQVEILKRSIDARGRKVVYRIKAKVYISEDFQPEAFTITYPNVSKGKPVLIIGAGPAGLFAALRCIELGLKPIIL